MSEAVFTIEDTFAIKGRRRVLVGLMGDVLPKLRIGDSVKIPLADGSSFQSRVRGIESFMDAMAPNPPVGILLDGDPGPLPRGTHLYRSAT